MVRSLCYHKRFGTWCFRSTEFNWRQLQSKWPETEALSSWWYRRNWRHRWLWRWWASWCRRCISWSWEPVKWSYGQARDLKQALIGRQPDILFSYFPLVISYFVFCVFLSVFAFQILNKEKWRSLAATSWSKDQKQTPGELIPIFETSWYHENSC